MLALRTLFNSPEPLYTSPVNRPSKGHWTKMPPLEPDVKADNNTYNGGQLPGITVNATDLSKPQPFPYGEIVVEQGRKAYPDDGHLMGQVFRNKAKRISNRGQLFLWGGPIEKADNTRIASGRPQQVNNKIPYSAGKGPAADSPMRLFNDPYINMGLMAMGPMVSRFKPEEIPSQYTNGVKYAPPTLKDIINLLNLINLVPKVPDNARVMGIGVRGLSKMTGKSPKEVIEIMSLKFGNPQVYPKAFDNSEPAYGWTFENPDHYRLALLLFNLK